MSSGPQEERLNMLRSLSASKGAMQSIMQGSTISGGAQMPPMPAANNVRGNVFHEVTLSGSITSLNGIMGQNATQYLQALQENRPPNIQRVMSGGAPMIMTPIYGGGLGGLTSA